LDQAHHDLLGRPIDPAAMTSFAKSIATGMLSQQVVLMILNSAEYRQDEVMNLYQTYLHRSASSIEISNFFNGGVAVKQLIAQLSGGQEYLQNRVPGSTNASFITQVYVDLLGRTPNAAELQNWLNQLGSGQSRQQIVQMIDTSAEYRQALVQGYYQMFLHRAATSTDIAPWVSLLNTGATDEQVIAGITSS